MELLLLNDFQFSLNWLWTISSILWTDFAGLQPILQAQRGVRTKRQRGVADVNIHIDVVEQVRRAGRDGLLSGPALLRLVPHSGKLQVLEEWLLWAVHQEEEVDLAHPCVRVSPISKIVEKNIYCKFYRF